MTSIIDAVLPVFGLIGVGAFAGWRGWLDAKVTDSLNLYVVWLALPTLLFRGAVRMTWADLEHPGFVAATVGGMVGTFVLSLLIGRGAGRRLADRVIEALAASAANNGYLGIPLSLSLFGAAILPALVITIMATAVLLFSLAIVLIEIDVATQPRLRATLAKAGLSLARNPLIVVPLLGFAWAATGASLPLAADRFVTLLSDSAGPCGLVTIGLFLAQQRDLSVGGGTVRATALKLVAQPLLTCAITLCVATPQPWRDAAILLAALPTGTGPFMLAKLYDQNAATASRTILLTTTLSVATISLLMIWLGHQTHAPAQELVFPCKAVRSDLNTAAARR